MQTQRRMARSIGLGLGPSGPSGDRRRRAGSEASQVTPPGERCIAARPLFR